MIYTFPTLHGAIGEAIGAYGRGVTTVLDPAYDAVAVLDTIEGAGGGGDGALG